MWWFCCNINQYSWFEKNTNAFELIIYIDEDFQSKWMHTKEDRFWVIKKKMSDCFFVKVLIFLVMFWCDSKLLLKVDKKRFLQSVV